MAYDGYSTPMDREFEHNHSHGAAIKATGDIGVGIGELGMSLGLGPIAGPHAIKTKLHPGIRKLEFVFMGQGKGSGQGHTPEQYGAKQRQALIEMGKVNRVDFTTHSTIGVYGLAGMDQQGNFSKSSSNYSLNEVKRAIEFAADISQGGPVVVHTGEFSRPVADADWNQKAGDPWAGKFEMYPEEEKRTSYGVIDTRTGRLIEQASKSREVTRPVWNVAEKGQKYLDDKGAEHEVTGNEDLPVYIDYFKKKVNPWERVPKLNKDQSGFEVHQMTWKELEREAHEFTVRAKQEWKEFHRGNMKEEDYRKSFGWRFKDAKSETEIEVRPEEAYIMAHLETTAAQARGWASYYYGDFDEQLGRLEKLRDARQIYEKIEHETNEEEKWRLKKQIGALAQGLVPLDAELPTAIIDKEIKQIERAIERAREGAAGQWVQAEQAMEQMRHLESANTYAIKEAADSYAQAALTAYAKTEQLRQDGRYKKPVAIALENLFPEHYGSHPDELMNIVEMSRKKMVQKLQNDFSNMTEDKAKKIAEDHITTTFDTGHLNMWRKYWKNDPNKTVQQNIDEFNKWTLEKVSEMAKRNMIGHVHIDDNYGYHDDHLAAGEGNTPIREIVKILKDSGYNKEMIIEPGADFYTDNGGFSAVSKTWRHLQIPTYSSGMGTGPSGKRTWNDVGYGWFGQNQPPYFVFGGYAPSEDFSLWSGVPLE